jgi:YesN/AraC family two-component response regulator
MNLLQDLKTYAKDLTLLIVEDDPELNQQLAEMCELFFKEVTCAYNGAEGLMFYEQNRHNIVITDITMPKMNGIDMAKNMKKICSLQPIIIISAHCHLDYVTDIIDLGIKQFIKKPFDNDDFLYRLLKVCEDIVLTSSIHEYNLIHAKEQRIRSQMTEPAKELAGALQTGQKEQLSSDDFFENMSYDIQEEIVQLFELKDDFERYIEYIYMYQIQPMYVEEICSILHKMYTILIQIGAMRGMSLVIFNLASFLETVNVVELSPEQKEKLNVLDFIYEDIAQFLTKVFVEESTVDIHYLEDSLKSSIVQLQAIVSNEKIQEEEFELF